MVREVVDDVDAVVLAKPLQASCHAPEIGQLRQQRGHIDTRRSAGGQRGQRIHHAVPAEQRPARFTYSLIAAKHAECRAVVIDQLGAPVGFDRGINGESGHRRPRAARQHVGQTRVLGIDDQPTIARHGAHQVVELGLDRVEVGKDVGVVELEVVEDRDVRPVVDELAALVEEGAVVFVGLDHEVLARRISRRLHRPPFSGQREKAARRVG